MPLIEVNDLTKEYRQYRRFSGLLGSIRSLITRQYTIHLAVKNMSFSIEKGEAVGYLGPNGAGKSTMIKMLTGILLPTGGEVSVNGRHPYEHRQENAKQVGVVFGQRSQLWWNLPVIDSFDLHRHMYRIPYKRYRENLEYGMELLDLHPFIEKPVRQLSLGQRMRAELALSILHEPDILFLDEPTIGLDVIAKERIRAFLKKVNRERGTTILLTTHDMKDIEEICPRIIVVNRGECYYDGPLKGIPTRTNGTRKVTIEFRTDPGRIELAGATLTRDEGVRKVFDLNMNPEQIFSLLSEAAKRYAIVDVSLEEEDIEEVIRKLFKRLNEETISMVES